MSFWKNAKRLPSSRPAGGFWPLSSVKRGFGENKSNCEGAPAMYRKMQFLALTGNLTESSRWPSAAAAPRVLHQRQRQSAQPTGRGGQKWRRSNRQRSRTGCICRYSRVMNSSRFKITRAVETQAAALGRSTPAGG